jgi:hypothetical protein
MKTFFYILQKCIKSNQIVYPSDPFQPFLINNYDKNFLDISCYIYLMVYEIYYLHLRSNIKNLYLKISYSKLKALNTFLNNIFISNELKEKILDLFCKAQRIYFTLSKFAYIYKHNKSPLIVTNDLTLNPLEIKHPATFVLLQNKSRYLFSMNDLINIIETAICFSPNFFASPLSPKNPYNNQKLNTSTLYNIYFKMKDGVCKFSTIIHLYFLECFVKHNFFINNEAFLREHSIKKFVYTSPNQSLYDPIKLMLKTNSYTSKLIIHEDFPKDMLVDIFRPYLFYYYIINYSIKGTEKIYKYKTHLHKKLKQFYEHNKLFGRKLCVKTIKKNKSTFSSTFNTDHINFYNIVINNSKNPYDLKPELTNLHISSFNGIMHNYGTTSNDYDDLFYHDNSISYSFETLIHSAHNIMYDEDDEDDFDN